MDASSINQPTPSSGTKPIALPRGADSQVTLMMEPTVKELIIRQAIQEAQKSIWAEMYTFTDGNVATDLDAAAKRGRDVQVLYDPNPQLDQSALQHVAQTGQQFPAWAHVNRAVQANGKPAANCHAKFMIIDAGTSNQKAYIMTTNFTLPALGVGKEYNNREYVVTNTAQQDIDTLNAVFQADQQGQHLSLSTDSNLILTTAPNLIISPINSYQLLRQLIESAHVGIAIQMEELNDPAARSTTPDQTIEAALLRAAQRLGTANVRVMLPPLKQEGPIPAFPANQPEYDALTKATPPVLIKTTGEYYMHAKLIIVDQQLAFVGSENLSWESLNRNREVGILISRPEIVQQLWATFDEDWNWPTVPQTAIPAN